MHRGHRWVERVLVYSPLWKVQHIMHHVDHQSLREVVVGQIRSMIIEGELAQGTRLVEGQLAEALGVSRNPVREAIRSLEATGLVDIVPRKGAYVCVIDHDEFHQIQDLILLIEGYAAEIAAEVRTDEDLERLSECITNGRAESTAGNYVSASRWHQDFHVALENAAGNPFLSKILSPLRHRTDLVFSIVVDRRGKFTWEEHEAIYEAVKAQDAEGSKKLVCEHITNALNAFGTSGS